MGKLQGPALYVYNDATFSQHDFSAISKIGQDSKLERLGTTGRFGLGFNAVYHFTDVPSFVSGDHMVFFDPHLSFLPGANARHPGLKIKFSSTSVLNQFPDQFGPFTFFGCDMKNHFDGTLFRFPLRDAGVAGASEIKSTPCTAEDVQALFEKFIENNNAAQTLLFLKNVRKVSVHVTDGSVDPATGRSGTQCIYEASLGPDGSDPNAVQKLATIPDFVTGGRRKGEAPRLSKDEFYAKLVRTPSDQLPVSDALVTLSDADHRTGDLSSERWLICSSLGGSEGCDANRMCSDPENKRLRLVPWAGCAAVLPSASNPSTALVAGGGPGSGRRGRAHCFLPLPQETGLPVQVNGYFELSSNRRDIWLGDDMAGEGAVRHEWNVALLRDVVAPTYARLLLRVIAECHADRDFVYSLWPQSLPPPPWEALARTFYSIVPKYPLVYSDVGGGKWIAPRTAAFVSTEEIRTSRCLREVLPLLRQEGIPVVRLPPHLTTLMVDNATSSSRAGSGGQSPFTTVCPDFVRSQFRGSRDHPSLAVRSDALKVLRFCLSDLDPSKDDTKEAQAKAAAAAAAELGLHAADCGVIPWNQYSDLHGLPMIPLADGVTMAKFADVTHGACYYLGNELEHEILSSLPHLLVDRACCRVSDETVLHTPEATSIITHLSASSLQRVTNVSPLGPVTLSKLLPMVLPAAWEGVDEVKDWATAGAVLPEWVKLLWKYLLEPDTPNQGAASPAAGSSTPDLPLLQGSQKAPAAPVPLDYYVEYPLLPTDQGSLLRLARRDSGMCRLVDSRHFKSHGAALALCLTLMGCRCVEESFQPQSEGGGGGDVGGGVDGEMPKGGNGSDGSDVDRAAEGAAQGALRDYMHPHSLTGLLDALQACCAPATVPGKKGAQQPSAGATTDPRAIFDGMGVGVDARRALRHRIASREGLDAIRSNSSYCELVRSLPIFEMHAGRVPKPGSRAAAATAARSAKQSPALVSLKDNDGADVAFSSVLPNGSLAPAGVDGRILTPSFFHAPTDEERQLLVAVGVPSLDEVTLYTLYIFPSLDSLLDEVRDPLMMSVLKHLNRLSEVKPHDGKPNRLLECMRELPFVVNGGGHLVRPRQLHDRRAKNALELLDEAKDFPATPFDSIQVTSCLIQLGLKERLDCDSILTAAKHCEALAGETLATPAQARLKAKRLLAFLDSEFEAILRTSTLEEDKPLFISQLQAVQWLPVFIDAPEHHTPWFNSSAGAKVIQYVGKPTSTRPKADMHSVSATFLILDGAVTNTAFIAAMGWAVDPHKTTLAHQLVALGELANCETRVVCVPAAQLERSVLRSPRAWIGR
jgi:sacsin